MNLNYYWESKRQAKIKAEAEKRRMLLLPIMFMDSHDKEIMNGLVDLFNEPNNCPDCDDGEDLCHLCSDYHCVQCWLNYLTSKDGLAVFKALIIERKLNKNGGSK